MNDKVESTGATLYRYRFGAAEFDESRLELTVSGVAVDIEQKPLRVLAVLLRHRGEVVSRDELLDTVWSGRVTVEQVLTNAIAKLRRALGEIDGPRIVTVTRTGYRFAGSVERTAIGTRFAGRWELNPGSPVPGRDHFTLHLRLGSASGGEVWVAKHRKSGELRVFKFAQDGERLSVLKREVTLYRVLREALGDREDFTRILDWNFDSLPFHLECEYAGPDLVQWADQDRQLDALSRSDRIGLFLQVADAVAAAHSVGVLHKDLKPHNVLVLARRQGSLQACVADFGSGHLLEPGRLEALAITRLGMTVTPGITNDPGSGTPLYFAPEVIAGGQPTVQSDVYALGLMLYQIVKGDLHKPLAPGWERDIDDALLVEDIAAATAGDPALRLSGVADLTQRLRALATRRAERESARIAAERAALAERALERARIRRPWIISALVVLVAGLAISSALYRRERTARFEAERAATRQDTTIRFLSDDLLGAGNPTGPGTPDPTIRQVLARTAATIDTRFASDPEAKASIELALGTAYFGLTDYDVAEKYCRDALSILTASEGPSSPAVLGAEYQLASILAQTNRYDEAGKMLDTADRLAGSRLAQGSRLALQAHWTRAGYYKVRMWPEQAAKEYAAAERIRRAIDPNNDNLLVRLRDALSWCYVRMQRADDAARVLDEVISPRYSPDRVGPVFWAVARIDDAIVLMSLQRYPRAEQVLTEALEELKQSVGPDHFFVGDAENELGELYTRRREWDRAVESLREAYRIFRLRTGEDGQSTLTAGANLGIVEYRRGRAADAVETLTQMRAAFIKTLGESSPQAKIVAFYLASAQCDLGHYREASELAANLSPAPLASAEPRDDWDASLQALRGTILLGVGRKSEARALLSAAVAAMEKEHTPAHDLKPVRKLLARAK